MKQRAKGWTWLQELYKCIFMDNTEQVIEGKGQSLVEIMKPLQELENLKMHNRQLEAMENKYYTPDIEDIRVGYEYEVYSEGLWEDSVEDFLGWYEYKFSIGNCFRDIDDIKTLMKNRYIRTAYLTKEQIEAEGWKFKARMLIADFSKDNNDINRYSFEKDNYHLILDNYSDKVKINLRLIDPSKVNWEIGIQPEHFAFSSLCPSINEFRTICKLLNI